MVKKLSKLILDEHNANLGTKRVAEMLRCSLAPKLL